MPEQTGLMEFVEKFYTGLRPLENGEYRVNPDGSHSTELSVHMPTPYGDVMMAPSLWMGPGGPVEMQYDEDIMRLAREYEQGTGREFPRWPTMEEAMVNPSYRSVQGGIMAGPMATYAPNYAPKPKPRPR